MDAEKELELIRLEFLKRGEDTGAMHRAQLALEGQEVTPISVDYPTEVCKLGTVKLILTVNMYASTDEIAQSLHNEVMGHIRFHKSLMTLDCPESERPQFETGRGRNNPLNQIEEIKTCLTIYDLTVAGAKRSEIVKKVYGNNRITWHERNSWDSDYHKVINHQKKAIQLIEAAKSNQFPRI